MKKINLLITNLVLISLFAAFGCITAMAQTGFVTEAFAEETRPFDFSDKFYYMNGVEASSIINRPNGKDGKSVFTDTNDEKFRNVRILETLPAYTYDGNILYWNMYGELFETGFGGETAKAAKQIADNYPLFVFPSTTVKESIRQSAMIDASESYFQKNPLGLSLVVLVEYTARAESPENAKLLEELASRNGVSVDGTPILRNIKEIMYLTHLGIVTQRAKGIDNLSEPSYAIAKVLQLPKAGIIAEDAYLSPVLLGNEKPLEAEQFFMDNFICLRKSGSLCQ